MAPQQNTSDDKDITLRDVIIHVDNMGQRLGKRIDGLGQDIQNLDTNMKSMEKRLVTKIDTNTVAIQDLTLRIDALEEDLTATIKDTVKIRQHVGMATVAE